MPTTLAHTNAVIALAVLTIKSAVTVFLFALGSGVTVVSATGGTAATRTT